ncbi:MAG: hypothetical protein MJA31_19285 [Clostridia bacterium]|nr:hypothetical protein [Clostridia bacterium]
MKKEKIIIAFLCIVLLIVTALWIYPYYQQYKEDMKVVNHDGKNETEQAAEAHEIIPQEKIKSNAIAQLIYSSDEVYLESYVGSENLIFLSNEDKSSLQEFIRGMELKFDEYLSMEAQDFKFILHLKNKNIGIYIGRDCMFVEDGHGYAGYDVKEESIASLVDQLNQTYLEYLNQYLKGLELEKIKVEALDVKQTYFATESDIKDIIDKINFIDIVDNGQMMEVPAEYPYYQIILETKTGDTVLSLVNDEVILINLLGEDAYFNYEIEFKDLITSYFEWDEQIEEDIYNKMFKAKSIAIKDSDMEFTMEKDKYYCLQMIRTLINANKEKVIRVDSDQSIRAQLQFNFEDNEEEITIYDNYIKYGNDIYRSLLIGDKLTEILNMATMNDELKNKNSHNIP